MWFLDRIVEQLSSAADTCYEYMWIVNGWIYPFWYLQYPLYALYYAFYYLAHYFGEFNSWLDWAADRIVEILTASDIWAHFKYWFEAAANAWEWVRIAWTNVYMIVNVWWDSRVQDVKDLIAAATQGFNDLVVAWGNFWTITWPQWTGELVNLRGEWDYFWTVTYPTLVSFSWLDTWWSARLLDVQDLINTAIKQSEPFWEGWQEFRDQAVEFFADPEEWVYKRLDSFFERFW